MAKKKVCVSFDYTNDKDYYNLLKAWDANDDFDFSFNDCTPCEIQTESVSKIKEVLTKKISEATYTLVIVGKEANKTHHDSKEIGYTNWQNFEIARSKSNGNKLVAIKISSQYGSPDELLGAGASWAYSFTKDAIVEALNNA